MPEQGVPGQTGQVLNGDTIAQLKNNLLSYVSGSLQDILPRAIITLGIILFVLLLRFLLLRIVSRRNRNHVGRLRWRTNTFYFAIFLILLLGFPIWLPSLRSVATVIGLFGAGILIVFKEIFLSLSAWFYIMIRRPFEVGNRVSMNGVIGDVIDIRLFEFTVMEVSPRSMGGQSTGRILHLPNALLWTQPLGNASKEFSFSCNEIRVPVKYGSDWKTAEKILEDIASSSTELISDSDRRIKNSQEEYAIYFARLHPGIFVEFQGGAVVLTLRHLSEPRTRRMTVDRIWREILGRFQAAGIELESDYHEPIADGP